MKSKSKQLFTICGIFLALFIILTVFVALADKSPIGPLDSSVGLSSVNGAIFNLFKTSDVWYVITEALGYLAFAVALGFALLGFYQLIKRKSLFKVDADILLLAGLYAAVAVFYVLFELFILNCRPVLVDGELEASYPSSHTMLFCTVLGSAPVLIKRRFGDREHLIFACDLTVSVLCTVMAIGRLRSGMHWFTDILSGVILSLFLTTLYMALLSVVDGKNQK